MGLVISLIIIWGCGYGSHLFFEFMLGYPTNPDASEAEQKSIKGNGDSFSDAIFWSDVGNS